MGPAALTTRGAPALAACRAKLRHDTKASPHGRSAGGLQSSGATALHAAVAGRHEDVVALILTSRLADVNITDSVRPRGRGPCYRGSGVEIGSASARAY